MENELCGNCDGRGWTSEGFPGAMGTFIGDLPEDVLRILRRVADGMLMTTVEMWSSGDHSWPEDVERCAFCHVLRNQVHADGCSTLLAKDILRRYEERHISNAGG